LGVEVDYFGYVDGFGTDVGMVKKLTCAEEVREEGIIIEAPHSVRSSWLE